MVNAKLAADSIKVGTKVYTVAQAMKLDRYGMPKTSRVKNDVVVAECEVMDIMFSMRFDSPDNWNSAVLLTLATLNDTIPGREGPYYRHLKDIPAEKCFLTYEEALHALEEMKGEGK